MPKFRVTKQEIWQQPILIDAKDEDEAVDLALDGQAGEAEPTHFIDFHTGADLWDVDEVTSLPRYVEGEIVVSVRWLRASGMMPLDIENMLGRSSIRDCLDSIESGSLKAKVEFSPLRVRTNVRK